MRSTVLFVASVAIVLAAPAAARAKPLLFVSAEAGGDVVVVDPAKAQVVERIKVGARPRGLKLSRDGRHLFVAVAGPPKAAPPTGRGGAAARRRIGRPRRRRRRVAQGHEADRHAALPVRRRRFGRWTDRVPVEQRDERALRHRRRRRNGQEEDARRRRSRRASPSAADGKVVYVAAHGADELSAIDPKTMNLLARIDAGMRPQTHRVRAARDHRPS